MGNLYDEKIPNTVVNKYCIYFSDNQQLYLLHTNYEPNKEPT